MEWDVVLPLVSLAAGYFADVGKMSLTARAERQRKAGDEQRATVLAFQDAILELVPVAQDACIERGENGGVLSMETHRALYQAHLKAEALRVQVKDDHLRNLADQWISDVYSFGVYEPPDSDFEHLITRFGDINERIGLLLRRSGP